MSIAEIFMMIGAAVSGIWMGCLIRDRDDRAGNRKGLLFAVMVMIVALAAASAA